MIPILKGYAEIKIVRFVKTRIYFSEVRLNVRVRRTLICDSFDKMFAQKLFDFLVFAKFDTHLKLNVDTNLQISKVRVRDQFEF